MYVSAAYAIEPRERLIAALQSANAEFAEFVAEPTVIWQDRERFEMNHVGDWNRVRTQHVQALFLLTFRERYYVGQTEPAVAQALSDLLGFPEIDVRTFDDWWTLRRIEDVLRFDGVSRKYDEKTLESITFGGVPIPGLVEAFADAERG